MYSVGIVTLTGSSNFGNRLQNFALQEALISMGVDRVETVRSDPRAREGGSHFVRRLAILRSEGAGSVLLWLRSRFGRLIGVRPPVSTHFLGRERESAIREFVAESIYESLFDCSSVESAASVAPSFDAFVVGSDQVWHPGFGLRDGLRFLGFANPDQRIAYAASFGVSNIPRQLEDVYRSGITSMADISVREYRAAEIVREFTGREVPVVLDPTMLLEPMEWEALAKVPQSLAGGGYVAEFFLGTSADEEMLPVQQFAAERGLDRVDLKSDAREDLATMGPLEFIGAIKASHLLVTDSFHA
ncbi:MAG: polysaccharide pyruvyl transferase family protein, partial [Actinobacteria bacterium]|nr:polysaccharide pyruvyl transferase family protein [Actinomycetota bacterium]